MKRPNLAVRIIFIVVIVFLAIGSVVFLTNDSSLSDAENRKESDFITKSFVVKETWYRKIRQGSTDIYYAFLKPENTDINLSFGMDKIFIRKNDLDNFISNFKDGDTIAVKMYKPEYLKASESTIFTKIGGFFKNNNNEVEIYDLKQNGERKYNQDITRTAINFRSGGDLAVGRIFMVLVGLVIILSIIRAVVDRLKKKSRS